MFEVETPSIGLASGIGDLPRQCRERVRDEFTSPRGLLDYSRLIRCVVERSGVRAAG
jgi:hypothetical protein